MPRSCRRFQSVVAAARGSTTTSRRRHRRPGVRSAAGGSMSRTIRASRAALTGSATTTVAGGASAAPSRGVGDGDAAVGALPRAQGLRRCGGGAATALQHGPSKTSVTKLSALLGISRRTLVRWRRWWSTMFAPSRFWTSLRGRFMPAVDEATMPASLLSRMSASDEPAVVDAVALARADDDAAAPGSERIVRVVRHPQRMRVSR